MSDEEVVVGEGDAVEEEPLPGSSDQGPYTGQSMDIPEEPYNPVAGMTPSEVTQQIAENQQQAADDAREAAGGNRRNEVATETTEE